MAIRNNVNTWRIEKRPHTIGGIEVSRQTYKKYNRKYNVPGYGMMPLSGVEMEALSSNGSHREYCGAILDVIMSEIRANGEAIGNMGD